MFDIYDRVVGSEILRYAYDPVDRLTNRWSAARGNTAYSYDGIGNLTSINYPSSTTPKSVSPPIHYH